MTKKQRTRIIQAFAIISIVGMLLSSIASALVYLI